ncbi:MAG: zinc ribbon domain-containing protein [Candidatus Hermodarchaeota archaeon]
MKRSQEKISEKQTKRLRAYLKDSPGTTKGIYYSFEPDLQTWHHWKEELGQNPPALRARYKAWIVDACEYFDELNQIFTEAKNWAIGMWFARPEFLVNYAFSHEKSENHLDNELRKAFEQLALRTPTNPDWKVPLPTQAILGGSKNEGGKFGALLRCLIRETIAPVRSYMSSMLVHSIFLLYLCRASELAQSQDLKEQEKGLQAINHFFTSRYLPQDLMHFTWDMYGAMQAGYYNERLQAFEDEKKKSNFAQADFDQLKELYKKLFKRETRHKKKEIILKALREKETGLQTKCNQRNEKKEDIRDYLGFAPSEELRNALHDLIWLTPNYIELDFAWKSVRNFFASLYVLQEVHTSPQATPDPGLFIQEAHAWTTHYAALKDLFTNPEPFKLAEWFTSWAYILAKNKEWKRITGARRLFIGKLLGHKGIIRAAYQQGVTVYPETLQDIQLTAPFDCVTPGTIQPIRFTNGNLNLSQDQWPTISSAFLRYYLADPQGKPYMQEDKLVHIDKITSEVIPVESQPTASIAFELNVPPSIVVKKQEPNNDNKQKTKISSNKSENLADNSQRWTTTKQFSGKGLLPYIVHQSGRKYQRPTLNFSKLDANGLPVLHFALEATDRPRKTINNAKKDIKLPIGAPLKPKGSIRVLALDPGTRNPMGYVVLEGLEQDLHKLVNELQKLGKTITIKTLAASDKYDLSNWNINVLYEGVLAGLNNGAQKNAEALVWKHYSPEKYTETKNSTKNSMFATLESQDRRIEKEVARIDRKIGHRYTEIQLLQQRKDQALVLRKHLAELLGCGEETICLRFVKKYFDSHPELMNKTRNEQAQLFSQYSAMKDNNSPLANIPPKAFWNMLYDIPFIPRLELIIRELYQKNGDARRSATHLLVNYLLEVADAFECDVTAMEDLRRLQPITDAKNSRPTEFEQKIGQLKTGKDLRALAFQEPTKTLENRLERFRKQPVPLTWKNLPKAKRQKKQQQRQKHKVQGYFGHLLSFLQMMARLEPRAKARRKVSSWNRGLMAVFLARKLKDRKDIQVVVVKSKGTSSRCCACHTEGTRNRAADTFRCNKKGCKHHIDPIHSEISASINIGLLGLWHILQQMDLNNRKGF